MILGACGPNIVSYVSTGTTAVWPMQEESPKEDDLKEPPGKKLKLANLTVERPNVTQMLVSSDSRHLVTVTAEDKCVRVSHITVDGHLQALTQRSMPKRPCAITLTTDNSAILCADKFGDVYALPLLPSPEEAEAVLQSVTEEAETTPKTFIPAATPLTVHSGRNRKALEAQVKQATQQPKTKEALKFRHELLLGHVSMLTDIAYATVDLREAGRQPRNYILTADRDEHIRVSRGPPQSHIIEGFCQGHREFVSKLCLIKPDLLVSGGGDSHLFVWDWLNCRLLKKINVKDRMLDFFKEHLQDTVTPEGQAEPNIAISGLWAIPNEQSKESVLVACEGVPALFHFMIMIEQTIPDLCHVLPLAGNPLDFVVLDLPSDGSIAVVSVDNVHEPGSTSSLRQGGRSPRLQMFKINSSETWEPYSGIDKDLEWFSYEAPMGRAADGEAGEPGYVIVEDEKMMRDLLYGVENLRKRAGADE